jgi:tRNA 2-thiouridine synthesizing protein C
MKNFSPTYRSLGDYEVKNIYVDRASLESRGLTQDDLVQVAWEDWESGEEKENIVEVVDSARVTELMDESEVIFSF